MHRWHTWTQRETSTQRWQPWQQWEASTQWSQIVDSSLSMFASTARILPSVAMVAPSAYVFRFLASICCNVGHRSPLPTASHFRICFDPGGWAESGRDWRKGPRVAVFTVCALHLYPQPLPTQYIHVVFRLPFISYPNLS